MRRRISIARQAKDGQPFFCWVNTTRMHVWTHLKPSSQGATGLGLYPDGMVELDGFVGQLLDQLDSFRHRGQHDRRLRHGQRRGGATISGRGADTVPWRESHQREGAFRVPTVIRWPGVIVPGSVINDICAHEDLLPTFAAAAGDTDVKERLLKGNPSKAKRRSKYTWTATT